ncbi:GntR family transcriptional regulator [Brevibacillus nitrificans]|uniref:GntR family transcriptional regulator n=1 Tax=Brevibacillus nitrificans TaxID=651560 RepID=UPI002627DE8A|nr:GntR family transcriptional regulator [Brevibacillus nitrificans]
MERNLISNNALSNLIKERITEDILFGNVQPGEKLIETQYADRLGTSRAPIREAFYLLELEGLVKKIPRKGTVVKGFTAEEMKDLLEIRNFLEEQAINKLGNTANSEFLNNMERLLIQMEENRDDRSSYAKLNYEFHFQLILASRSDVLKNFYSRLGTPLLLLQSMSFMGEKSIEKSLQEHKELISLIKQQELEKALTLLRSHNQDVFLRIEKHATKSIY